LDPSSLHLVILDSSGKKHKEVVEPHVSGCIKFPSQHAQQQDLFVGSDGVQLNFSSFFRAKQKFSDEKSTNCFIRSKGYASKS
jgi:hypothetical protein